MVSWGFYVWLNTKQNRISRLTDTLMSLKGDAGKKKKGGWRITWRLFLTPGYVLWACQVVHLCCTADIAEDSVMQGRWPQPLYKPQEALRTDDKCPERPRRVPTSTCNSVPRKWPGEDGLGRPEELTKRKAFLFYLNAVQHKSAQFLSGKITS